MTGAVPNIPLRNWRGQQCLSRAEMADRIYAYGRVGERGLPAAVREGAAGILLGSAGACITPSRVRNV